MFKALLLSRNADKSTTATLTELDDSALPPGDVTVRVAWSTLNYKDALAITNRAPVVRAWPMIAGIDGQAPRPVDAAAGKRAESSPGIGEGVDGRLFAGGDPKRALRVQRDALGVAVSVEGARVFNGAIELLVHIPHADGRGFVQLMVDADGRLLLAHGLQVGVDGVRPERRMAEVRRAQQTAVARGRAIRTADEILPVVGVERVVVLDPLVATERAAGQFELEDVVEDAPRTEHLPVAVTLDVVGETGARRRCSKGNPAKEEKS